MFGRLLRRYRADGPVERLPLDPRSPWWGEHRSRYRFAQRYARGKRVLDIACGTGFGCAMLAEAGAVEVIGVDLDAECVAVARKTFCQAEVRFVRASGIVLPFPSGAFDLVTSFETLEHIEAAECFVRELRRVTKPDGQLLLSTPNFQCTNRYPPNPFHIREFNPGELAELLGRFYHRVEIRGQRVAPYYRVVPFLPGRERARTFGDHFRLIAWKLGNRLPFWTKDLLARACTGHHFYPTEVDYSFENGIDENVPVLVVTCHAAE